MRYRHSVVGSVAAVCLAMATFAGCGPLEVYDPDAPASQAPVDVPDEDGGGGAIVADEDDGDGANVADEDDGGGGETEPDD